MLLPPVYDNLLPVCDNSASAEQHVCGIRSKGGTEVVKRSVQSKGEVDRERRYLFIQGILPPLRRNHATFSDHYYKNVAILFDKIFVF
ncbi:hypothetical protein QYF36_025373 [Acer negundo]|nr:hypothetical protein QYF36_025373 [Acer negundo]